MHPYFKQMETLGKELSERQLEGSQESFAEIKQVEEALGEAQKTRREAGMPVEKLNQRGFLSVWQRMEYLIDPGSYLPLHSIFDPTENPYGSTAMVDGMAKINGKWVVIAGFDNKVLAGAWVAGQSENMLRVADLVKRLNVPLVWLVNCSGVDLPNQELVYPDRRGGGTMFFRHAELQQRVLSGQ